MKTKQDYKTLYENEQRRADELFNVCEIMKKESRKELFEEQKRGDYFFEQFSKLTDILESRPATDQTQELLSVIKTLSKFL